MKFTEKDWIATGLVAALIIVYGVYLAADGAWLAQNARDMAIVGLVAGFLSRLVAGRTEFSPVGRPSSPRSPRSAWASS